MGVDFGTSESGFAYRHVRPGEEFAIKFHQQWPDQPQGVAGPKTRTAILYELDEKGRATKAVSRVDKDTAASMVHAATAQERDTASRHPPGNVSSCTQGLPYLGYYRASSVASRCCTHLCAWCTFLLL